MDGRDADELYRELHAILHNADRGHPNSVKTQSGRANLRAPKLFLSFV